MTHGPNQQDLAKDSFSHRPSSDGAKGSTGKALDTMRSVVQNVKKVGFNCESVPFIPFLLTRKMDVRTRREFDTSLRNSKLPVTLDDLDQFL